MVLGEEYLLQCLDLDLNPTFTYFLLISPKEIKITHLGPKMPLRPPANAKNTLKLPLYCRIFGHHQITEMAQNISYTTTFSLAWFWVLKIVS